MYSYIKGTITEIEPGKVTLETYGIGYHIVVPNPFKFTIDETIKLYIYQHVREDALTLFGFKDLKEKRLFDELLSVKGIGPKSALAVLASAETEEIIRAIEMSDTKYLNRFPGIGPKASQQIVLDLKGKIKSSTLNIKSQKRLDEVGDALRALGYKNKEIERATKNLDTKKDTSLLIKDALKTMANKK
ncbi:MAG: Holliday junction branch migration protein RuvA [Bacillota bacterium]